MRQIKQFSQLLTNKLMADIIEDCVSGSTTFTYGFHVDNEPTAIELAHDNCGEDARRADLAAFLLSIGGKVRFADMNDLDDDGYPANKAVGLKDFADGLMYMALNFPNEYADLVSEDGSYDTMESYHYIQAVVYGKVIY